MREYSLNAGTLFNNPNDCILYTRCDHDKYRWWNTWFEGPAAKQTANRQAIGDECFSIAEDMFQKFPNGVCEMQKTIWENKSVQVVSDTEFNLYYEGEHANYWIRGIARQGDYNMYVKAYKKEESI